MFRRLAVIALAGLVVAALAGCAQDETGTGTGSAEPAMSATETEAQPAPASTEGDEEGQGDSESSSEEDKVGSSSHATDGKFCEEHECEGDFTGEPGTIVQCSDGSYSHAGGISGACSDHGGEKE